MQYDLSQNLVPRSSLCLMIFADPRGNGTADLADQEQAGKHSSNPIWTAFRGYSQPSARVVRAWLVLALQVQQTSAPQLDRACYLSMSQLVSAPVGRAGSTPRWLGMPLVLCPGVPR